MLLSQAILLGSMLSRQGFGGQGVIETRCALETACDVIGAKVGYDKLLTETARHWPWTDETHVIYPCATNDTTTHRVLSVIWMLNDHERWTRPRIAAWVATVEPPEPLLLEHKLTVVQENEPCTV